MPAGQWIAQHHFQVFDGFGELKDCKRNSVPRIVVKLVRACEGGAELHIHQNIPTATIATQTRKPNAPMRESIVIHPV